MAIERGIDEVMGGLVGLCIQFGVGQRDTVAEHGNVVRCPRGRLFEQVRQRCRRDLPDGVVEGCEQQPAVPGIGTVQPVNRRGGRCRRLRKKAYETGRNRFRQFGGQSRRVVVEADMQALTGCQDQG